MPTLTDDEVFGTAAPAASATPQSSKAVLSDSEVWGGKAADPFTREALEAENRGQLGADLARAFNPPDKVGELKKGIGNVAAVLDMGAGLVGQGMQVAADLIARANELAPGSEDKESTQRQFGSTPWEPSKTLTRRGRAETAGKEGAAATPKSLTNPIRTIMSALGFGKDYTGTDVEGVMNSINSGIGGLGKIIEASPHNTEGITKADVESLANTFMFALGARGTQIGVDKGLAALAAPKRPEGQFAGPYRGKFSDKPRKAREAADNLEKENAAEAWESQQRATFAEDAYTDWMKSSAEVREARWASEKAAAEAEAARLQPEGGMPARTRPADRTAVDDRARTLQPSPFNGVRVTEPTALDSGLAKMAQGRAFDMTAQEKVAVNSSSSSFNRPRIEKGAADQKLLTAMALGGTGLGLAMAMKPDKEESALAIGAGALLLGRGRGEPLTLERLGKFGEATPLGAILNESPVTLTTLERLPQNRFEFSKQMIEEQLKRPDVTQAEKDVFRKVLDANAGPTVTAKELMTGVKVATGDWELKAKESDSFADYGLERIDRKLSDDLGYEYSPEDAAGATIQHNPHSGRYDVLTQRGELLDTVDSPAEFEAWKARAAKAFEQEPPRARTTIYQAPLDLGTNNHFSDPNYFAHTRSFDEGGVRHVVEIQSDLAQKAGKVLTAEERAAYTSTLLEARKLETKLKESGVVGMYVDNPAWLETFRRDFTSWPREVQQLVENRVRAISGHDTMAEALQIAREIDGPGKRVRRDINSAVGDVQERLGVKIAEHEAKLKESAGTTAIQPLLKNWHKRIVREELAGAAREGAPTVRFATADTVAKVEGWPHEPNPRMTDGTPEHLLTQEDWTTGGPRIASPEHQSIYDRYQKDVTKLLKQLGGTDYTDPQGHTWIEVPTSGSKSLPAGPRTQMFGGASTDLLKAAATIGGGAALAAYLFKPENRVRNAAVAAAVFGLAMWAHSRSSAVRDYAESIGTGADKALGLISTRLGEISRPLQRRLDQLERKTIIRGHDYVSRAAPLAEKLSRPLPNKAELNAVILTNDPVRITVGLGKTGDPQLVADFREARKLLDEVGKDLVRVHKLKDLLPDYFPRVVIDLPGLLEAVGKGDKGKLAERLDAAEKAALVKGRGVLSPYESSQIINKYFKEVWNGASRPGFLKPRSIKEIPPEFTKFYAPPGEGLLLNLRAAARAIEKAEFFGEDLVRTPEGQMNIDESIGNITRKAEAAGTMSYKQAAQVKSMLQNRFGPGEAAMSRPFQAIKNITYIGLLANPFSAIANLGDTAAAVAAHGVLSTIKSLVSVVTKNPQRYTVQDLGLVNHIIEDMVVPRRKPLTVAGRNISLAKMTEKSFRLSGFSPLDTVGKAIIINAAWERWKSAAKSEKGKAELSRQYKDYFGPDFERLQHDLETGRKTELTDELIFRELADLQPITKAEMPEVWNANPNARLLYTLRGYTLKQADIIRRKAFNEIKKGTAEGIARGTKDLLRFGMAMGISNASSALITSYILYGVGEVDWGDVPDKMLATLAFSRYVIDEARQGKPVEAAFDTIAPPWKMWQDILTADPSAIKYFPVVGKVAEARMKLGREKTGAEKKQEREDKEREDRYNK